jgi:hypothetical protein
VLATVREAAERDLDRAERVFAATVDRMLRDVAATDARILTGVLKRLGKDACKHPGYITHGRNGYPYDGDCGPYCPACDAAVEL